jgi:hypothetical protein
MPYEDDIRAAFHSLATQAPDADTVLTAIRDKRGQPTTRPRRGRPGSGRRLLVPLAAAAAVVAVIATSVTVGGGEPARNLATSNRQALASVPRYYLELIKHATSDPVPLTPFYAAFRNTVTGATLATVRPPKPFGTFLLVAAAADDRTFVLSAQRVPRGFGPAEPTKLFRAQLNPAAGTVTLTPLPVPLFPAGMSPTGLALSPDGTKLAVALQTKGRVQIRVYSLTTGQVKVWQDHGMLTSDGYLPKDALSWARSGALAFTDWVSNQLNGVWLLNTNRPGGSLLADSRLAVSAIYPGARYLGGSGIVTPDGSTIVAAMWRHKPRYFGDVREFSAATGKVTRTMRPVRAPGESVVWTNSSGSVLIVWAPRSPQSSDLILGVLSGKSFTPIPKAPTMPLDDPLAF